MSYNMNQSEQQIKQILKQHSDIDNNNLIKKQRSKFQILLASTISGVLASFVVNPFEIIKIRQQIGTFDKKIWNQKEQKCINVKEYYDQKSMLKVFNQIVEREGWGSLTQGYRLTALQTASSNIVYFQFYEYFKQIFKGVFQNDWAYFVSSASLARAITTTLIFPIDYFRTLQQTINNNRKQQKHQQICKTCVNESNNNKIQYNNSTCNKLNNNNINIISQSKWFGMQKMFSAYFVTIKRDVIFSAIFWSLSEELKLIIQKNWFSGSSSSQNQNQQQNKNNNNSDTVIDKQQPFYFENIICINIIAGSISALFTGAVTIPLDLVKTRKQVNYDLYRKMNTYQILKRVVRKEGVGALLLGYKPRIGRILVMNALNLTTYECYISYMIGKKIDYKF